MMAKQRQKKRKPFLLLCPQTFTTIFWIHSQYKLKTLCVYNIWITKKVGFTLQLIIVNHFLFFSRKFWLRYSQNKISRNCLIYDLMMNNSKYHLHISKQESQNVSQYNYDFMAILQ